MPILVAMVSPDSEPAGHPCDICAAWGVVNRVACCQGLEAYMLEHGKPEEVKAAQAELDLEAEVEREMELRTSPAEAGPSEETPAG